MIPMACVMSVAVTLTSLNRAGEMVALFAAGMSLIRIAIPSLVGVFVISLASFWIGDQVLPQLIKEKFYLLQWNWKNPTKFQFVRTDRIWYRSKNSNFYY